MDNISRTAAGVPTGGEFAAHTRTEAAPGIIEAAPAPIVLAAQFTPHDNDELSETPYPETMPEPKVAIEFDSGEKLTVTVGDETYRFWEDEDGYPTDDTLAKDGGRFANASEDDNVSDEHEQFTDWGNAVFANVGANIYAATMAAITEDVEKQLIKIALNK